MATRPQLTDKVSKKKPCQVQEFGCNGTTPQSTVAVAVAAVDPATTMALVNQLRAALIANGICT